MPEKTEGTEWIRGEGQNRMNQNSRWQVLQWRADRYIDAQYSVLQQPESAISPRVAFVTRGSLRRKACVGS
jgi:hypothetical protein